jgi:pimeloyl-ACP methyl ester carboxylesterase
MRGLQAPPKQETPSRLVARLLMLIILVGVVGLLVYTAVTNQRIDLVEDIRTSGLELDDPAEVNGVTVNVEDDGGSGTPVVILHGVDIAGTLNLEPLAESLSDAYRPVRIDLPGFGYSDRIPIESYAHTTAGMADTVSAIIGERFSTRVVVVGAGFGGEVAAELAHSHPDLVLGAVMVDVDFWSPANSIERTLERLPWIGKTATYTWETGGQFALDNWSPYCEEGGWCPSSEEESLRAFIVEIADTTVSLHEFLRTEDAALASANLEDITVPLAYVWSTEGVIEAETVDRVSDEAGEVVVVESATFQAHLEDYDSIAAGIEAVASGNQ